MRTNVEPLRTNLLHTGTRQLNPRPTCVQTLNRYVQTYYTQAHDNSTHGQHAYKRQTVTYKPITHRHTTTKSTANMRTNVEPLRTNLLHTGTRQLNPRPTGVQTLNHYV